MRKRKEAVGAPTDAIDTRSRQEEGQFVVSLSRGFSVLSAFGDHVQELTNAEIAERAGLSKPTVTRLTFTLMKLGYLDYTPTNGGYRLAAGVVALAAPYLRERGFIDAIRADMRALAHHAGASVAVTARRGTEMVYIACEKGAGAIGLRLDVGSTVPIATTTHGRAYLSLVQDTERDEILAAIRAQAPESYAMLEPRILAGIADIRAKGYCTSFGEWSPDVNSVAVAIRLPGVPQVYAMNCGAPSHILTRQIIETDIAPRLMKIGAAFENTLQQAGAV